MTNYKKISMLKLIRACIAKYGYHQTFVMDGKIPRFVYTIGVSQIIGAELIFAGGSFYSGEEVGQIIKGTAKNLITTSTPDHMNIVIDALGSFSLHQADPSWSGELMLGTFDFYQRRDIPGFQIVPDNEHWTLDIPDLTRPWSAKSEPVWRWLHESWEYPVPPESVAATNLDALRGERITEAARWEDDQWELFAGAGPDVPPSEVRVIPLGTLLAVDPSLEVVTSLKVGKALWRDTSDFMWRPWE
jgi:uncharacterized protein DUF4262